MQGGAESSPLSWESFEKVRNVARNGAQNLFALYQDQMVERKAPVNIDKQTNDHQHERVPLFSLKNRQSSSS